MSDLPSRPSLDLSLPPRPTSAAGSGSRPVPSLLSRIALPLGLPPKPIETPLPSSSLSSLRPRPLGRRPSPTRRTENFDRRGDDHYIPRSPSPERADWDRADFYRPSSPSRHRSDWDRSDSYIARPSPPPPSRPISYRRPSPSRSRSPVKRSRSPSPELPNTFYTYSHKQAERSALESEKRAARRLQKEADWDAYREQRSQRKSTEQEARLSNLKRPPPTGPANSPIPAKVAKVIPTGPRLNPRIIPGAPTGPRVFSGLRAVSGAIPTGPRALGGTASYSTQAQFQKTPFSDLRKSPPQSSRATSPSLSIASDNSMSSSRGRGRGARRGSSQPSRSTSKTPRKSTKAATSSSAVVQLDGPLRDHSHIMATYGQSTSLPSRVFDNPKNIIPTLGKGDEYVITEGFIGGKKMFRATLSIDTEKGIVAVGDASTKKEAEKLAALSAAFQAQTAGFFDKSNKPNDVAAPSETTQPTATLSDGSSITYDRARQFMEYYCKRYKFGKPDVEFTHSQPKSKKGRVTAAAWEAVMTVGGRKIGMGTSSNKKGAQVKCYLDVTQYLESCDAKLWSDFVEYAKNDKSGDVGTAPSLAFQMSDNLHDDIYGLCRDIRNSTLHRNAPPAGVGNTEITMPGWSSQRSYRLSKEQMRSKSMSLKKKLDAYHQDPKLEKMRAARDALPVKTKAQGILDQIEANDVIIIMAATGSGKTTQVPQLIFDQYINRGQGARCNVLCTQPRRLAATSVAERIADERGDRLGNEIGYQVRFDTKLPQQHGSITFCTTGIFLKRMQSSLGANAHPTSVEIMDEVTHIIVDEVHERDIDTDLSLVVLKQLLADRKARGIPLKLILMSATVDPTLFQNYFKDDQGRPAPIAEVPGRTFPVEKHFFDEIEPELRAMGRWAYRDKKVETYVNNELSQDSKSFGPNTGIDLQVPYPLVALTIAHVLKKSDDGHVLVFLPGWDEIRAVANILLDTSGQYPLDVPLTDSSKFSVHYLHSAIPAAEQREVFSPPPKGVRRIILATNIAETSVTIPDVVYVVDSGRVKEQRYEPERHMTSLVAAWVGQSNLNQRAGRAGRHRPGEYYSLVSNQRYKSLNPHQMVEMKRSDLSNVVMHVKALNLGEVESVLGATIEPPETSRIISAMESLRMLGAMDDDKNLTSLGKVLLQIPVEAALGKICLYGSFFRCLDSALTLAAVLGTRDPFLTPLEARKEASEIKDSWSPLAFRSDPLAVVAAYNVWTEMDDMREYRKATQWCHDNFLHQITLKQIKQVKRSLAQSLDSAGIIAVSAGGNVDRIGRRGEIPSQLNEHGQSLPLLAALIAMASAPNFAVRTSDKLCRTATDKMVMIGTSSVNSRKREAGGPEEASASFHPAEKRLYAFGEKHRIVAPGSESSMTLLRNVTRLDPMTYMLFGAYELVATQRGHMCDLWLPVNGNLHALDDIQRLKTLLDKCMLRVFEGVGKTLVRGRDQRRVRARESVKVVHGSSRIEDVQDDADEGENESDDEGGEGGEVQRVATPLSIEEIKELELLTTDVVKILNAYALEREGTSSRFGSRPASPGLLDKMAAGGGGGGGIGEDNGGMYRPPQLQAQPYRW